MHICSRVSRPVLEGNDCVMLWRVNPFTSTQSHSIGPYSEALSFNLALQVPHMSWWHRDVGNYTYNRQVGWDS